MVELPIESEEFKDSPIGKIPVGWEAQPLGEITDLQVGYAFKSEWFEEHEGIRLLRGENVGYGKPDWSETRRLPWKMYPKCQEYELTTGDIVIGMDRTFTKSGFKISVLTSEDVPALLVQRVGKFVPTACDRQFLKALLNSEDYQCALLKQQKGMDIPHLSQTEILEPIVAVPPIQEQQYIAEILNTIDSTIAHTSTLIAKLKQMKAGLLHDLLTRGLDENGKLRDAIEHPEQFKDSPLGQIQKDWTTSILDTAIKIIDCKHYTPRYVPDGVPVVRPRNVKIDGLDFSDIDYVSDKEYRLLTDKHEPKQGDIVFSRNASFGIPCYVETSRKFAIGQDVVIMTELTANTRFIYYTLISASTTKQIKNVSAGSTFGRIDLAAIRNLIVPLPPIEEQEQVVRVLEAYDIRMQKEEAYLEKLKEQKKGLMHDLLTGRVRVTALKEIPA